MMKMKILQIVNNLECGGLEKLVIDLALGLKRQDLDCDILCLGQRGELAPLAEAAGLKVFHLNKKEGFTPFLVFQIYRVIRKNRYHLTHTHNLAPLIYGSIAARLAGIKTINTRHGRERKFTHRYIWQLNSLVAAVSGDAETELIKHNCMAGVETRVIYNGIDIDKFRKIEDGRWRIEKRKELGLKADAWVVGIVARLAEEKDHGTLLRAMADLLGKIENGREKGEKASLSSIFPHPSSLKLLIIGDGPLRGKLEEDAKKLGIEDKVIFLGFCEDVSELLQVLDLFVLSSTQEGVSLTLLEAMAASKPIVATDVGGNPEVVVHGQTGLLVPPKNPEKMAEAILEILNDPQEARRMGEAGRKRVEEKFSLERMVGEYEKVYEEVMSKK